MSQEDLDKEFKVRPLVNSKTFLEKFFWFFSWLIIVLSIAVIIMIQIQLVWLVFY